MHANCFGGSRFIGAGASSCWAFVRSFLCLIDFRLFEAFSIRRFCSSCVNFFFTVSATTERLKSLNVLCMTLFSDYCDDFYHLKEATKACDLNICTCETGEAAWPCDNNGGEVCAEEPEPTPVETPVITECPRFQHLDSSDVEEDDDSDDYGDYFPLVKEDEQTAGRKISKFPEMS